MILELNSACPSGRSVPGAGQHAAAGRPALHPDGLLPGQSLQHSDQTEEPAVPAGHRPQSPRGKSPAGAKGVAFLILGANIPPGC